MMNLIIRGWGWIVCLIKVKKIRLKTYLQSCRSIWRCWSLPELRHSSLRTRQSSNVKGHDFVVAFAFFEEIQRIMSSCKKNSQRINFYLKSTKPENFMNILSLRSILKVLCILILSHPVFCKVEFVFRDLCVLDFLFTLLIRLNWLSRSGHVF